MRIGILVMSLIFAFSITSLGCDGVIPTGPSQSLADHEVELDDSLARAIPFPESGRIRTAMERDGEHSIIFSSDLSYSEIVEFYAERLAAGDWEIKSENIREEGERMTESNWRLHGHGVDLHIGVVNIGTHSIVIFPRD